MYSATSTRSRISPLTLALPALWNECKRGLTLQKSTSNSLPSLQLWRQLNVASEIYYFMSSECFEFSDSLATGSATMIRASFAY